MNWIMLKSPDQLEKLRAESKNQTIVIFKHSTRCSISQTALSRLERNWDDVEMTAVKPYFLDLISYQEISNGIADLFDVEHQSPQIIVLKDGEVVLNKSHFEIDFLSIKNASQVTESSKN